MKTSFALAAALAALPMFAQAQEVIRHKLPDSDFPIARAVEIPAGKTTVYLSGAVPSVADAAADPATPAAWGDTKTQTVSVLTGIDASLKDLGLSMGDVVKMQVFLVGDASKDGKLDFKGFMEGYTQFFGTKEQPNLPARSVFQVAGLAGPGFLVEIEVIAARP